jgi:hypothetical protein
VERIRNIPENPNQESRRNYREKKIFLHTRFELKEIRVLPLSSLFNIRRPNLNLRFACLRGGFTRARLGLGGWLAGWVDLGTLSPRRLCSIQPSEPRPSQLSPVPAN